MRGEVGLGSVAPAREAVAEGRPSGRPMEAVGGLLTG